MQGTCQLLLCEVRYEARGHIALLSTALYLKQVICRHPATNIEASLTHLLIKAFTHHPFILSPFGCPLRLRSGLRLNQGFGLFRAAANLG